MYSRAMSHLDPEQIADEWNPHGERYDEALLGATQPYALDAVRLVGVGPGQRVLDIAAGTGAVALAAAEAGADVVATDFSPGMAGQLAKKAQERGLSNVQVEVMNGQDLSVEDDSFDAAFSSFGLMMFPDRAAGFREMCRALKPGGRGAVVVWGPPDKLGFFQWMIGALQRAVPDLPPPERSPSWLEVTDRDVLRNEMLAAFSRVNVYTVGHVWTISSPEWLAGRVEGLAPGTRFLFEKLEESAKRTYVQTLAAAMREQQGDGPYALESIAHIAVGTK